MDTYMWFARQFFRQQETTGLRRACQAHVLLPLHLFTALVLGILSFGILLTGAYLLYRAARQFRHRPSTVAEKERRGTIVSQGTSPTLERTTRVAVLKDRAVLAPLLIGICLLLFTFAGRHLAQYAFPQGQDEPEAFPAGTAGNIQGAGGANLRVESFGDPSGPTLVFTHGWGVDSSEWFYARKALSSRFHLILWDLPGLGGSSQPEDRNFALEDMARDLRAVVSSAGGKPVTLVGHSIGGMINLTFCRVFPDLLGSEVARMVQIDTSYTNPVKTTQHSEISQSLQKPLAEPALYAMVGLSPLVHFMNWLSYQNGTAYAMNAQSSFAGSETRGQVDLVSRLQAQASPAVIARGTLAMFHWDATPVLPQIRIPVLLIVGAQDTTTVPVASEFMKNAIPSATLVEVPSAAHYSLLEQNERVNSEIARFVTGESR
jgi:pimeloyl-ACP methyl ester carboxylesterase